MSSHQLCIDSIIIKIWNCQMIDPLTNAFKVMYERWCCGNINRIDSCRQIVLVMVFPAWKIQNYLVFQKLVTLVAKGKNKYIYLMSGSSHIRSVLIVVEYRNCRRTLDVYLLFAILLGKIKSKLNYRLVTYKLASP